jgi:N6-L-threonylcarbamoyladenine synthase
MERKRIYCLGIDTSNYRTSLAAVDADGNIAANCRKLLAVRKGERGLRQSEALFQHVENLPVLAGDLFRNIDSDDVACISISTRPRPLEGSYMPVFNAGASLGRSLAAALKVPLYEFSHQEGHIEAVRFGSPLRDTARFISFHFSGGTTEAVLVEENDGHINYSIIGGSRDISYGQLLDRLGVFMGMEFPCGEEMDAIACDGETEPLKVTGIKCRDGYINLSGTETMYSRLIGTVEDARLISSVFRNILDSIADMTRQLSRKYEITDFLYAGGVSSSSYIREALPSRLGDDIRCVFGDPGLSSDNAAGTALLGRRRYVSETR